MIIRNGSVFLNMQNMCLRIRTVGVSAHRIQHINFSIRKPSGNQRSIWEGIILLPASIVLLYHRERRKLLIYTISTLCVAVIIYSATLLQSFPGSSAAAGYNIFTIGHDIYFRKEWWETILGGDRILNPFYISRTIHFLLSLFLIIFWTYQARESLFTGSVFLAWTVSGLLIPLMLPGGVAHLYYMWGSILPVTLSLAFIFTRILKISGHISNIININTICYVCVVLALLQSGFYIHFTDAVGTDTNDVAGIEFQDADIPTKEAIKAGNDLNKIHNGQVSNIVFVDDRSISDRSQDFGDSNKIRVLIYSRTLLKDIWRYNESVVNSSNVTHRNTPYQRPIFLNSTDQLDDSRCYSLVVHKTNEINVTKYGNCPSTRI